MQVINYQKLTVYAMIKNTKMSGFICPFVKDDCVYMDSSSLTKTVNCNRCENFLVRKKTNKRPKYSVSDGSKA
jgi:hypothetical protein